MNALMRSSRFDDMPTVSAFAIGRSVCADVVTKAAASSVPRIRAARTLMAVSLLAMSLRRKARARLHAPGAVFQRDDPERLIRRVLRAGRLVAAEHDFEVDLH